MAFKDLKGTMAQVCVLTIPMHTDVFVLHTDASGDALGATLNVNREGAEMPVAFFY